MKIELEIFCEEALLIEKLNAFLLFKMEGMQEALRIYPNHTNFLQLNKNKKLNKIRKEILHEFLLLKMKRIAINKGAFNRSTSCPN